MGEKEGETWRFRKFSVYLSCKKWESMFWREYQACGRTTMDPIDHLRSQEWRRDNPGMVCRGPSCLMAWTLVNSIGSQQCFWEYSSWNKKERRWTKGRPSDSPWGQRVGLDWATTTTTSIKLLGQTNRAIWMQMDYPRKKRKTAPKAVQRLTELPLHPQAHKVDIALSQRWISSPKI